MWGDIRVDIWFYAMLLVAASSCIMFFTKSKWCFIFYTSFPLMIVLNRQYEQAIFDHLLDGVPIRLDIPFVMMVLLFPLCPIIFHAVRTIRSRKHEGHRTST